MYAYASRFLFWYMSRFSRKFFLNCRLRWWTTAVLSSRSYRFKLCQRCQWAMSTLKKKQWDVLVQNCWLCHWYANSDKTSYKIKNKLTRCYCCNKESRYYLHFALVVKMGVSSNVFQISFKMGLICSSLWSEEQVLKKALNYATKHFWFSRKEFKLMVVSS